uniref:Ig-like domain-containing protein n=1 Tax=Sulfurovum sp. TaxID=1969726 RepID=UPI0035651D26
TVTITAAALQSIALTPANPSLAAGITQQLTATGTYSDGTSIDITASITTWSSAATAVATVNSSGLVSSVDVGSAVISASLDGISGTTTVTTTAAVLESIVLTPANPSIAKGLTQQLTATGTYSDGSTLNITDVSLWTSSNSPVATFVSHGNVYGENIGSAVITASYNGISGSTTVSIMPPVLESITVSPSDFTLYWPGDVVLLTSTGHYSDGSSADITGATLFSLLNGGDGVAIQIGASTLQIIDFGTTYLTATAEGISTMVTVFIPL